MSYELKKYEEIDYEFIYDLKKQAYKDYVIEYWSEWNEEKQRELFKNYIDKQSKFIKIIIFEGQNIGFFDAELSGEVYEINNICIDKKFQGQGIGTKVLKEKLNEYKNYDIKIQCFKSNPVVRLYERLGFFKDSETETHIKLIKRE